METKHGFIKMTVSEFENWLLQTRVGRTILKIQQHHTFIPGYIHFNGSNHFERQLAMKNHHVNQNGWRDIGQHFTIFPDGTVMTGRSLEFSPACITNQNANAICIENLGNFDTGFDEMTTAQKEAIVAVTAALCKRFNLAVNTQTIVYHHWFRLDNGFRNNGTGNIANQDPKFIGNITYSLSVHEIINNNFDYRLANDSPAINAGTDSTDIGVTGGLFPWPRNANGTLDYTGAPRIPNIEYFQLKNTVVGTEGTLRFNVKGTKSK
ncbi:MAG: N-acetylmuramoyl-L-alanine amidase [Candidatus Kapabacteria bacterium]|nr:N-acetylmuramoyl-L-alanine amidase [Candidatus Kapabacteria bacterium]